MTAQAAPFGEPPPIITILAEHTPHPVRLERDYNRTPESRASRAAYYRARMRALWRLAKAHPVTYQRFLTEELGSEPDYRGKR